MLQTPFKNYEGFKELFVASKDGEFSRRKNGILLAFHKSKEMHKFMREHYPAINLADVCNMNALYEFCTHIIRLESARAAFESPADWYPVRIMDDKNPYFSETYQTDGKNGICVDGSFSYYRYQNMKRDGAVFKMKIGRIYRYIMDATRLKDVIPEPVKLWLCEELTRQWEAYTASKIPGDLVLHVDDDFAAIYDATGRCEAHFNSCMQKCRNYHFYEKSVKAKAAYLTRGDAPDAVIVARCIVFTEVTREDTGEVIRVAERQYSTGGEEVTQRILIQKLKEGGYIDAYKKTGAGCGDAAAFVDLQGRNMSDVVLSIKCNLHDDDYMSYQDSFKWYNEDDEIAYNHEGQGTDSYLDSTDLHYNGDCDDDEDDEEQNTVYSEYHGENIPEDDSVYVESRDDNFWNSECNYGYVGYTDSRGEWRFSEEYIFVDDCIEINGEYYYAGEERNCPEDYGLVQCPECGGWMVPDRENSCHSELLDKWFCCDSCCDAAEREYKKDNDWAFAEWDDRYFEDAEDVVEWVRVLRKDGTMERQTIFKGSLEWLIKRGEAVRDEETGIVYRKAVLCELAE